MTADQQPFDSAQSLTERLDIDFALQAAGLGVWELDPTTLIVNWDDRCRQLFGLAKDNQLPYEQAIQYIHPDDMTRVDQAVRWAMTPQSGGAYDVTYRTLGADDHQLRWVRFLGRGYFTDAGQIYRFAGVAQDVTQLELNRQRAQSDERFRSLVEQAPVATCLFVGRELRIDVANQAMIEVWGKGSGVIGMTLAEALPELKGQLFLPLLDELFTTGDPYSTKGGRADLVVDDQRRTFYFNYDFKPLRGADGSVYAILETAIDVTAQVLAQQHLAEKSRDLELALAIGQLGTFKVKLPDQTASYSQRVMNWFGLPTQQEPLSSIFARIHAEDQPGVVAAIEGSIAGEQGGYHDLTYRIVSPRDGRLRHLHSIGQVRRQAGVDVAIDGILRDVTVEVTSWQALEEREAALRNAIELAELGNFSVDVATQVITVSPRVADWFGFETLTASAEAFIGGVGEGDRDHVRTRLFNTLLPGSDGRYDVVHSVIHAQTGRPIILHALGQVYRDVSGQPVRIEGTAHDITTQREQQQELERQVQLRTQELATANQQLATVNKELAVMNEELVSSNEALLTSNQSTATANQQLSESNHNLVRSNDNLQQFAYIASHDLQEPLRKIQQFGDLLKTQHGEQLGDGLPYLERMQSAASRMSVLIKDLLDYARITTQRDASVPVSLPAVVANVLTTLEWRIQETGAQVQVGSLPTLLGDASQLGQLFQNLLSNALKFHRADALPVITVQAHRVEAADLPASVKPSRVAGQYYRIEVADNGVGFEEKYLDRIFQVFQRLHGKNEFVGTGIGLAICEKVVTNHGGAITASSQPGQGATFHVYLPG